MTIKRKHYDDDDDDDDCDNSDESIQEISDEENESSSGDNDSDSSQSDIPKKRLKAQSSGKKKIKKNIKLKFQFYLINKKKIQTMKTMKMMKTIQPRWKPSKTLSPKRSHQASTPAAAKPPSYQQCSVYISKTSAISHCHWARTKPKNSSKSAPKHHTATTLTRSSTKKFVTHTNSSTFSSSFVDFVIDVKRARV